MPTAGIDNIPKADLVAVIRNIYFLAKRYGVEKLADALFKEDIEPVHTEVVDAIISKTCKSYNISRSELMYPRGKGTPAESRMMCYVLIKKYLGLSCEKIGMYFDKKRSIVERAYNVFLAMNPKIKVHKDFLTRFEDIDGEMFEFFKSVMAKNKLKPHGNRK